MIIESATMVCREVASPTPIISACENIIDATVILTKSLTYQVKLIVINMTACATKFKQERMCDGNEPSTCTWFARIILNATLDTADDGRLPIDTILGPDDTDGCRCQQLSELSLQLPTLMLLSPVSALTHSWRLQLTFTGDPPVTCEKFGSHGRGCKRLFPKHNGYGNGPTMHGAGKQYGRCFRRPEQSPTSIGSDASGMRANQ